MRQVVEQTPLWVWGLLASLIVLGLAQVPQRRVGRATVLVLPVAVLAVSAFALLAAFGPEPGAVVIATLAALFGFMLNDHVVRSPRNVRPAGDTGEFVVPGSWLPLLMIIAIFASRFAVGLARATDPAFAASWSFLTLVCGVTGISCGVLMSRAARVLASRAA